MSDRPQSSADMAVAERNIREAMNRVSPLARCDAMLNLYWHLTEDKRDVFVAVLIARLTLVPPARSVAP